MVMRAKELEMTTVLKGTKVDGIYTQDPAKNPYAQFILEINYEDYLALDLKVVDFSAVSMARQYEMKIKVFNFFKEGNFRKVIENHVGSVIQSSKRQAA